VQWIYVPVNRGLVKHPVIRPTGNSICVTQITCPPGGASPNPGSCGSRALITSEKYICF